MYARLRDNGVHRDVAVLGVNLLQALRVKSDKDLFRFPAAREIAVVIPRAHPEAAPGPRDADNLFAEFARLMEDQK